jgi:uncharacterized protein
MSNKTKVRILSLDGGGIRGVVPAYILGYIESEIISRTGNPKARIADYFDMITGTSTGAILTALLLTPADTHPPSAKFTAADALSIYTGKGNLIFNASRRKSWMSIRTLFNATRYKPENIERILQEVFGDRKMSDLLKPCIITAYNMATGEAIFFSSREREPKRGDREFLVRDVVRSSTAAPVSFPPATITNMATGEIMINIDGGVFANNPAMCAYAEARATRFPERNTDFPKADDMILLSVGTGSMPVNITGVERADRWGLTRWARTIPGIMMDGGLDTVSHQMKRLFEASGISDAQGGYKRVDVPEHLRLPHNNPEWKPPYNHNMADASDENINNLLIAAEKTLAYANTPKENELTLNQIIDQLITS